MKTGAVIEKKLSLCMNTDTNIVINYHFSSAVTIAKRR